MDTEDVAASVVVVTDGDPDAAQTIRTLVGRDASGPSAPSLSPNWCLPDEAVRRALARDIGHGRALRFGGRDDLGLYRRQHGDSGGAAARCAA